MSPSEQIREVAERLGMTLERGSRGWLLSGGLYDAGTRGWFSSLGYLARTIIVWGGSHVVHLDAESYGVLRRIAERQGLAVRPWEGVR